MKQRTFLVFAWGLLGVLALSAAWLFTSSYFSQDTVLSATRGDPRIVAFADWPARYQEMEGDQNYTLRMASLKGYPSSIPQHQAGRSSTSRPDRCPPRSRDCLP